MVPPIDDEELLRRVEAYQRLGTPSAAAKELGISRSTLDNSLVRAAERGLLGFDAVLPGYALKRASATTDANGKVIRRSVVQTKAAVGAFNLPAGHIVKGVSSLLDAEGNVVQQWVKTRQDGVDLVAAIKAAFDDYKGRAEPTPPPEHADADLLSVYPIADVHHGLLAWGREAGEDYDLAISAERLRSHMAALIAQAPPSSEALILNLGDYFHINDATNATPTSGHRLDVDSRFFKVLSTGVRLFIDCIDLALAKHERVTVRCLPGNHDPESSVALTVALSAFYHGHERVAVDASPSEFFFRLFGTTLIGACHGHRMKPDRMAMAMATLRPEDWGKAKYRWFLFGHIHHETLKEVGDVRCESFQTLAAKDAWNSASGYTSGQSISSITLHRERGEIGRHRVNLFRGETAA